MVAGALLSPKGINDLGLKEPFFCLYCSDPLTVKVDSNIVVSIPNFEF
jgi:hypothetical protein